MLMNKTDLVDRLAPHVGGRQAAGVAIEALVDVIIREVAAGETVGITGFGTFERRCSEALWAPVVRQTVDLFGPSRCLFGSNFPVEKLWTTYPQLLAVMRGCLSVYSQAEQREIFHDVAVRSYKMEAG